MLGKTEQTTGDYSTAYQSGRDMKVENNYGMDYRSVKQLCLDLIHDNFPKLQQEAMQEATGNVLKLADQLKIEMEKIKTSISPGKLAEPDTQAALNDAVQGAALKGEKSDINLLAKLIASRLNSDNSDLVDITLEQAIKIAPKLTKSQLDFLSVRHFVTSFFIQRPDLKYAHINDLAKPVLQNCASNCVLSEGNLQYLAGVGVLTYNGMFGHDVWDFVHNGYKGLEADRDRFKASLKDRAPNLYRLIQIYEENRFQHTALNSFGEAIALSYLSKFFGTLDLRKWIR